MSFGLPVPLHGVVYTSGSMETISFAAKNTETLIPDLTLLATGDTDYGLLQAQFSQNSGGCAKFLVLKLYRNGVLQGSETQQAGADTTSGADVIMALAIPPMSGRSLMTVTITSSCPSAGPGTVYSASRSMTIPAR